VSKHQPDQAPGRLRRAWQALRRPSSSHSVLFLTVTGIVIGIVFWGGFHTVVEATNTEEFCIGCHEMYDNVYQEYQKTIHYTNRTGVRAVCSDCHVPREWGPKMVRKVQASRELWGKLVGSIDTREKFEAKRLFLARREWARMKANDSLECRNCHSLESMEGEKQKQRARKQHEIAQRDGDTCIDCHKGVAHQKPAGMTEADA
jgi:cytochrome c-type protein NapC